MHISHHVPVQVVGIGVAQVVCDLDRDPAKDGDGREQRLPVLLRPRANVGAFQRGPDLGLHARFQSLAGGAGLD